MKAKLIEAHGDMCRAGYNKRSKWYGGIPGEQISRDGACRKGGSRTWYTWTCADPGCPAKIAIRYDAMVEAITALEKSEARPQKKPSTPPRRPAK
jgi:hypothetical protein